MARRYLHDVARLGAAALGSIGPTRSDDARPTPGPVVELEVEAPRDAAPPRTADAAISASADVTELADASEHVAAPRALSSVLRPARPATDEPVDLRPVPHERAIHLPRVAAPVELAEPAETAPRPSDDLGKRVPRITGETLPTQTLPSQTLPLSAAPSVAVATVSPEPATTPKIVDIRREVPTSAPPRLGRAPQLEFVSAPVGRIERGHRAPARDVLAVRDAKHVSAPDGVAPPSPRPSEPPDPPSIEPSAPPSREEALVSRGRERAWPETPALAPPAAQSDSRADAGYGAASSFVINELEIRVIDRGPPPPTPAAPAPAPPKPPQSSWSAPDRRYLSRM